MVKRKDAVANRERLIVGGFEILAVRDADLTVRELALETGLGIGTAYRHFPTHEDLIRELYDRGVETLRESLQPIDDGATAWDTLVGVVESAIFALAGSPGLRIVLRRMYDIDPHYRPAVSFTDQLNGLVTKAQREGSLRSGITGADLALMVFSLGGMVGWPTELESGLMRRQLVIFFDGLRADGACSKLPDSSMDAAEFHALVHRSNAPHA